MSFKKRLLSYLKAAPSMPWLTEVECLQNDYSQANNSVPYIDTEVKASWDVPFELVATVTKTSANRCLVLGNAPNQKTFYVELTASNRLRFSSQDSTGTDPTFVEFNVYTSSSYPIPLNVPTKIWVKYNPLNDVAHTIKYELGLEALDGSVSTTQTGSVYRSGQPLSTRLNLRMFNDYRTPVSTFNGGFKIHQCEIKMGTAHKKFIPCLDLNRIPCMYEQVDGKLYYNAGTGGFNVGRRITEVEWINLTGSQRFNTGFKPNTLSTTLKATFQLTGADSLARFPFGCRKAANQSDSCTIYIAPSTSENTNGYLRLDWPFQASNPRYSIVSSTEKITLEITGNYANINGEKNTSSNVTSYDQAAPFYIGNCYTSSAGGFQSAFVGKFYIVNLLNTYSRENYRYCVPAHDENNVGFFFDRTNHFIMDNAGSNTEDMTWGDEIHYVSYLESTGPQWIDTGVKLKSTYGVEIDAKQTATTTGVGRYLFGDSPASSGRYTIVVTSGGNQYRFNLDALFKDSGVSGYDGKYHFHKVDNKTYFIDGESKGSLAAPDFTRARNARLFNVATTSTLIDNYWQIKQGKIFDENGNVLTNFVPCVKGNNKPAMFDLVSRTFATNQATGDDFKYGNSILGIPEENGLPSCFIPVESLQSTGTQYIDTGIKMNADWCVQIDAKQTYTAKGTTRYLFGTYDSSNVTNYYIAVRSGSGNFIAVDGSTSAEGMFAYDGSFHEHKIENGNYYIDDTLIGALTTQSFTPTSTAYLFGCSNIGFNADTWMIRKCKIFDGTGRIIADYVPCIRTTDHKPGMFDLITGLFLTNAGTGEFLVVINGVSYTPVRYLQSTSAQYINTGISGGDDDIEIGIKFKYSTFISFGGIFGNWVSDSYNTTRLQLWDGSLGTDVSNLNTLSSNNGNQYGTSITKDVVHSVIINKTSITIDGVTTTRTKLTQGTSNTNNICLFNRSLTSPNTSRNIGLQVYDFYVKKSNAEVQHLVPAIRQSDSKPGMLDMVTGTFLTNIGTGEFTYG